MKSLAQKDLGGVLTNEGSERPVLVPLTITFTGTGYHASRFLTDIFWTSRCSCSCFGRVWISIVLSITSPSVGFSLLLNDSLSNPNFVLLCDTSFLHLCDTIDEMVILHSYYNAHNL
jgi:hypothetical protein